MQEIDCIGRSQQECTSEPNCLSIYANGVYTRCRKRNNVDRGVRYHFVDGKAVVIDPTRPIVIDPTLVNLQQKFQSFDFKYDPDDPQFNEPRNAKYNISRRTIGQGTNGITFFPAYTCADGTPTNEFIGKVFVDNEHANTEWNIVEKIRSLPGNNNLVYPIKQCLIKYPKSGELKDWLESKYLVLRQKDPGFVKPKKLTQHLMRYYGKTLREYIDLYYLTTQISRIDFIHILEKLFWGVDFLNRNGIIHQDLKAGNVVVSNRKGLRIIDFGWAIEVEKYYKFVDNQMLLIDYRGVSPPENYVLKYVYDNFTTDGIDPNWYTSFYKPKYQFTDTIDNDKATEEFIQQVQDIIEPKRKQILQLDSVKRELVPRHFQPFFIEIIEYMNNGDDSFIKNSLYLSDFSGEELEEISEIIISGYTDLIRFWKAKELATRHDIYSVGMIISNLLQNRILIDEADDDKLAVDLFNELVSGITRFNPILRFSTGQAYDIVKKIIKINYYTPEERALSLPHKFPFQKNLDTANTTLSFMQFGSRKKYLKDVLTDIKYLKKLK
jgi:serine/threonine protein kinase